MPIDWTVTPAESRVIDAIAHRAVGLYRRNGVRAAALSVRMDVTATHRNGTPLDLERLLEFPDVDFAHDIGGINRHLDRETGALTGLFVPRSARRASSAQAQRDAALALIESAETG